MITELLEDSSVIAAVRENQLEKALASKAGLLFLLSAKLHTAEEVVSKCHDVGKKVFIHIDLMEGIRRDRSALTFLKEICKVDGILTTHSGTIRTGKDVGLLTIQRIFILDSSSLTSGIDGIARVAPHAVEIMPGIIPKTIGQFSAKTNLPLIAGGLIETKEEIIQSLKAGAISISTSKESLWDQ